MNIENMDVRVKNRTDSLQNWETYNPILYNGEIGISLETDDDGNQVTKLKVGDGVNHWTDLSYVTSTFDGDTFSYITLEKNGRIATVQATNPNDGRVTTVYLTDGKDGANGSDGADGVTPIIDSDTGNWIINGVVSSYPSRGEQGERGEGFSIYGYYNTVDEMQVDTEVPDGEMVIVEDGGRLFLRESSHVDLDDPNSIDGWLEIGDFSSITAIRGEKGDQGDPGITPIAKDVTLADGSTIKHWFYDTTDSGIIAEGIKGDTGENGADGYSPQIEFTKDEENGYSSIKYSYQDGYGVLQNKTVYLDNGHYFDIEVNQNNQTSTVYNTSKSIITISYIDGDGNKQSRTLYTTNGVSPTFLACKSNEPTNPEDKETMLYEGTYIYINPHFETHGSAVGSRIISYDDCIEIKNPKLSIDDGTEDGVKIFTITNADDTEETVSINTGWVPDFSFEQDSSNDHLYTLSIEDVHGDNHTANISSSEITVSDKAEGTNYYDITTNDGIHGEKTVRIYDGENAYNDSAIWDKFSDFEGGMTYTDTEGATVEIGGWSVGDTASNMSFQEFAYKLLHPYMSPIVTLAMSPSTVLYHKGDNISAITLTANVTRKTNDISTVYFLANNVASNPAESISTDSATYTKIYNNITTDTEFQVKVSDTKPKTPYSYSNIKRVQFVDYTYVGYVTDTDIITEDVIKNLSAASSESDKITFLLTSANKKATFTLPENSRIIFAYPQSYGKLSSIKDGLNFEYLNTSDPSYSCNEITIDEVDYYYYMTITPISTIGGDPLVQTFES